MSVFSYNPGTQLRSGEIQAQGLMQAAQIFGTGVSKAVDNMFESKQLEAQAGMLAQQGLIDEAALEKFTSGNLGTKRGIVSQAMTKQKIDADIAMMQGQFAGRADLARQQADLGSFSPEPDMINRMRDLGYEWGAHGRGGGSWYKDGSAGGSPEPFTPTPEDLAAYKDAGVVPLRDPATGKPILRSARSGNNEPASVQLQRETMAASAQSDVAKLTAELVKLDEQINKRGEDAKRGPNWNPLATSFGEQRAQKLAELAAAEDRLRALANPANPVTAEGIQAFERPQAPAPIAPQTQQMQPPMPSPADFDEYSSNALFGGEFPPGTGPVTPPMDPWIEESLVRAREWIKLGNDPEAVKQRLRQAGIDPNLL